MLVAGAYSCHFDVFRTRRKTGFRIEHLSRFKGAKDAAPIGSTRFGPIHGWGDVFDAILVVFSYVTPLITSPRDFYPRSRRLLIVSSSMP